MKKRCVAEAHVVDGLSECQGGKACFFFTACAQKKSATRPTTPPPTRSRESMTVKWFKNAQLRRVCGAADHTWVPWMMRRARVEGASCSTMVLAGFNSNVRMLKKVCKRDLGKQTMLSAHSRAVTHDGSNDAVMQSHRAHVQSRTLICVMDGLVLTLRGGRGDNERAVGV